MKKHMTQTARVLSSPQHFLPLKLALIGFVFPEPEGVVDFHNPLLNRSLVSSWLFRNWLCFA